MTGLLIPMIPFLFSKASPERENQQFFVCLMSPNQLKKLENSGVRGLCTIIQGAKPGGTLEHIFCYLNSLAKVMVTTTKKYESQLRTRAETACNCDRGFQTRSKCGAYGGVF